ncbi:MAG TPA: proline--tRNA ligase [Sediminispirochaeta sp.]|nr:proline--tRNA ligase [Sediminispirochaeta sp.]
MTPMRYTEIFGKTLRHVHHGVKSQGFAYLIRGGFVRPHGNGLFSYLPLGMRVVRNIKKIIREEMESLNGQEVMAPLVNPQEIWEKSGRDRLIGNDMIHFTDRTRRNLVIAPSHEEAFVEMIRTSLRSYRDLPIFLYQFQHKFRDEERPRYGLIRGKEFMMKDAYSFHRSSSDLNNFFPRVFNAYMKIFDRCGLEVKPAESGVGYMGGSKAYEFMIPCDIGEDTMIECSNCDYRANKNVAMGLKEFHAAGPLEMEEIATPDCTTMEELSRFLEVGKEHLAKTMVFRTLSGIVMAVVRGDYEVSREKLAQYLGEPVLDIADENELRRMAYVPGYLSPIGMSDIKVIVDTTVAKSSNLVVGGNREGVHIKNANFGRDFESNHVVDIAMIKGENRCLQCGGELHEERSLEIANIFKLQDFYSRSMELYFQEERGGKLYPHMGSYGIGIDRLIGAMAEKYHDRRGLIWPSDIAPFRFFLMGIGKSISVRQKVEAIYQEISEDTLLDDRKESPGVKFQDAELMGIPYRIVVSAKRLEEGEVELFSRYNRRSTAVKIDRLSEKIEELRRHNAVYTGRGVGNG